MKNSFILIIFFCAIELISPTATKADISLANKASPLFQFKGIGACSGGGTPETEICNGIDDDCNGVVDDNAIDAVEWCRDADLDTYGDPQNSIFECTVFDNSYVLNCGDCDDNDPNIGGGCEILVFVNGFESTPP